MAGSPERMVDKNTPFIRMLSDKGRKRLPEKFAAFQAKGWLSAWYGTEACALALQKLSLALQDIGPLR
ncbi:hypothetical protein H9Q10_08540 [Eikenella sp. S3360]|uniref:Uncharacterized protein n=1 Tax=Eikenella glucosivorans TaxID=2766967 RepID=A0ABS0NBN1_9NEIS|nr:hypothetical protein [Eikenella glucosivorans]MBH5329714.1 hypothetical protein [Eikenella glucosivorans]